MQPAISRNLKGCLGAGATPAVHKMRANRIKPILWAARQGHGNISPAACILRINCKHPEPFAGECAFLQSTCNNERQRFFLLTARCEQNQCVFFFCPFECKYVT